MGYCFQSHVCNDVCNDVTLHACYVRTDTAVAMKLSEETGNSSDVNHAVKFTRWQHPAMGPVARFAVPASLFIIFLAYLM